MIAKFLIALVLSGILSLCLMFLVDLFFSGTSYASHILRFLLGAAIALILLFGFLAYGQFQAKNELGEFFSLIIGLLIPIGYFFKEFNDGIGEEKVKKAKLAAMTVEEKKAYELQQEEDRRRETERHHENRYGSISPKIVCMHCQVKGQVRTTLGKSVTRSSGGVVSDVISGTGRTTTKDVTQFHCDNCDTTWSADR